MTLPDLQTQSLSCWRPHPDPYTSVPKSPLAIALASALTRQMHIIIMDNFTWGKKHTDIGHDFFVTFCLVGKVFLA